MSNDQISAKMAKLVSLLEEDLRGLRAGRASTDLVGELPVSSYGQFLPIKQLAGLGVNDQGQITVQVWDASLVPAVETAIRDSQLGFSLSADGAILRLSLPPLSADRRQDLVKLVHQKGEAARVALRQVRSDAHQHLSAKKTSGELREDDLARQTKALNELIDRFNQQVKELVESKEHQLLFEK